jgi:hypothetical protein
VPLTRRAADAPTGRHRRWWAPDPPGTRVASWSSPLRIARCPGC